MRTIRIWIVLAILLGTGCKTFWPHGTLMMKRRLETPFGGHEILRIGESTNYIELVTPSGVLRINPPLR